MLSPTPSSPAHERRFSGKRPRRPLRLDMTALVSVSLLLLIFFVYERTQGALRVVDLTMPLENGQGGCGGGFYGPTSATVLTLILGRDKAYTWRHGDSLEVDSFSYETLQPRLLLHQYRFSRICERGVSLAEIRSSHCWDPIFLVKPTRDCRYGQFVTCLDLLTRIKAHKYAIEIENSTDRLILSGHKDFYWKYWEEWGTMDFICE